MGVNGSSLRDIYARNQPSSLPNNILEGEGLAVLFGDLPGGGRGQTQLRVGMGFADADFVEVFMNSTRDTALLSVVQDGVSKLASVGGQNISVSRLADGTEIVRIFGDFDNNDLGFVDADPGVIAPGSTVGATQFASSVDEVLRQLG